MEIMPKRLKCNRCEAKPRIGGKDKLGKMNNLCRDCALELIEMGDCPCCGNPLNDHTEKCVTKMDEVDVTDSVEATV
jgi:predicted amidophosphoribosyltransferase